VPTDLRSTLHQLALDHAAQIVAAIRSAPLREFFELAPDADAQLVAERVSRVAAAWAVKFGLSNAEADVLRRAALREGLEPLPRGVSGGGLDAGAAGTKLQARIRRLRGLAAKRPTDSTRYAIGAIIKELKSEPETFGESAVSAAASAVGEDQATLYRFASVAERWTASQVKVLLSGNAISWSHLVALARIERSDVRERLLRRLRQKRLSLRELQVLIGRGTK
jgi:hypothetical protein